MPSCVTTLYKKKISSIDLKFYATFLIVLFILIAQFAYSQSTPVTAGYRDFNFGSGVDPILTGEKPQSKLWLNDGIWWGSLWDPALAKYAIQRLDLATQSWVSTGTTIDDRGTSRADALWDGQYLYIASNVLSEQAGSASASQAGRLYRYTYDSNTKTYSASLGFPVNVNSSVTEALVLDKDSTGRLWVTWVEKGKVKVNRSTGADNTWGTPFDLPVQGNSTSNDDISSILAFDGNKIGICWSNQPDKKMYFAVHLDSDADNVWQPKETALGDGSAALADDHICIKYSSTGNIYFISKASLSGDPNPGIYFNKRAPNGVWSNYVAGLNVDEHTRPILLIDDENQIGYIFAKSLVNHNDVIVMKSTSLTNIAFANGIGTPFIQSTTDKVINNPTSTKQALNGTTDLVVLASDETTRNYMHNFLNLTGGGAPPLLPVIASFTPDNGLAGTVVTITGSNFTGATSVKFNGTSTSYLVDSDTKVIADVPPGATTGKISVTTPNGVAVSSNNFTVPTSGGTLFTFTPLHDTFVKKSSPTSTNGTLTTMRLRLTSSETLNAYLKFDVSGLTGAVTSAKLRLKVTDAGTDGGSLYAVSNNYLGTSTPWVQTGLTWNNAPAISGASLSSAGAVSVGSVVELDVTAAITGNEIFSFGLKSNASDVVQYSTQEGATKPELVIQTDDSVPPPPTAPTIASFSPLSGVEGTEVTIVGTNFSGANSVKFSGVLAASFFVDSATQIRASVPTGAPTGKISVTTGDGSATSADDFTVTTGGGGTPTQVTLNPVHDTYVRRSTPTSNFGNATSMRARKTNSDDLQIYLKFDVQALSGVVSSAKLRLYVTDASNSGGSAYTVSNDFLGTATPWTQTGMNWNNAPLISGAPLSAAGSASVGAWIEFPVTAAISGNGIYSFGVKTTSSDAVYYASQESTNKPQLVIETSAVPFAAQEFADESSEAAAVIEGFSLAPNYPNPFNAQTAIEYNLPEATNVRLVIYNTLGQTVRILVDQEQTAGAKIIVWDGRNAFGASISSGVYFYRLEAGSNVLSRRMILQQ